MSEQASAARTRLRLADFVLDLESRELLTADDRPVELRAKALEVLLLLAEHAGRVVDKSLLMDRVWRGVVVGDDSLTQTVVEIRRALGDGEHRILCTMARRGYRLQPSEPSWGTGAPSLSVAVLPIAHDAADADAMRLAAALTSELTSCAGVSLPDCKVIARETVAAMGDALHDPRLAARRLGVQQLVCGELRPSADGWSVALAVVDGVSGARRWSHQFALANAGPPGLISQVAAQTARALHVEMHRTAAQNAALRPLSERTAADVALQGWTSIYDGLSPGNLARAQVFFEQALEKDPCDLRAMGGLVCSNYWRAEFGWAADREQARRRVIEVAAHLATLHPDATLTALVRGDSFAVQGRYELRLSIGDRLCERDPSNPSAHAARALALLRLGRFDDCLAAMEQARRLSLDDFRAGWWSSYAATAHLMANRPALAAVEAQRAIAANACLPLPPLLLAAALELDGRSVEGREILNQHRLREPICNYMHVEMLLGAGGATYEQGRARLMSTFAAMGLASRQ